jgi:hypothetical protein
MYALKDRLAIDGKAMYLGGWIADAGPRTLALGRANQCSADTHVRRFCRGFSVVQGKLEALHPVRIGILRWSSSKFIEPDLDSAVEEPRFSAALPMEGVGLQPQWRHWA